MRQSHNLCDVINVPSLTVDGGGVAGLRQAGEVAASTLEGGPIQGPGEEAVAQLVVGRRNLINKGQSEFRIWIFKPKAVLTVTVYIYT